MAKQLADFLKDKFQTEFEFTSVVKKMTSDNQPYAVLTLKNPYPKAVASIGLRDDETGAYLYNEVEDIMEINVATDALTDQGITINEDGTGKVATDLRLDVSGRDAVWLVKKSFRDFKAEKRAAGGNKSAKDKLAEKIAAKMAKNAEEAINDEVKTVGKVKPQVVAP